MPDYQPTYRYRGHVKPSAEVSRPVAVHRHAATATADSAAGVNAPASATLDIFDVIDSYGGWWGISSKDVDAALKSMGEIDTLYVRLNSVGGEATEGVAIANLLRAHPAKVRMTVYGLAASAASIIATAGDHLSMAPGSLLMIHEASGFGFGNASDMQAEMNALNTISDSYASLYALKAGGTAAEWRTVMAESTWYTPESAVAAKLADVVGLDPSMPGDIPGVETDDDDTVTVELDIEINPAARAAARRSDLSLLPAAAMATTKTPADQPVTPPTDPKEAVTMTDTIPTAGLVKALGLPDDADEDTILEAVEAKVTASAAKPPTAALDVKAIAAALEADGKVVVSQARLDALTEQATQGAQARAKQLSDERDELIEAAMASGRINRSDASRASWEKEFARDPETAKTDLESLPARFPIGTAPGSAGSTATQASYTDDMAAQDAELFGLPKEAFSR